MDKGSIKQLGFSRRFQLFHVNSLLQNQPQRGTQAYWPVRRSGRIPRSCRLTQGDRDSLLTGALLNARLTTESGKKMANLFHVIVARLVGLPVMS